MTDAVNARRVRYGTRDMGRLMIGYGDAREVATNCSKLPKKKKKKKKK